MCNFLQRIRHAALPPAKLESCGWDVVRCCAGVSLVAKPTAYLGKRIILKDFEAELSDNNFREAVFRATGLCINSGVWTGIPDHCRFTIVLSDDHFERALKCISQLEQLVLGL